ncbi:right-handed parallel beta-helix repeat-containing protein [Pseudoxanthobacter sp. M-2]|uniref:right-handed parallel beta-helix repeat-containing protein n=1 Tax=Pseudoxanthobacter sp. M-2 TaxID=3078754 RepID=UPI0038FCCEF3
MATRLGRRLATTGLAALIALAAAPVVPLLLPFPASAQAPQPFSAAVPTAETIRTAYVAALSEPDAIRRAAALDGLAETMRRLAATQSTTARAVRTELAEEGILADVVLMLALEHHLAAMSGGEPHEEIVAIDLVLDIADPARQTAGWLLLADAAAAGGHVDRAAGIVGRAIETAQAIDGDDRIAAFRAVSERVAAFPPQQSRRYLRTLLGSVPDARARAGIVRAIVRPADAGDAAPTAADAVARLEAGALWPAVERLVATVLPSDDAAATALRQRFLAAALAAGEGDAALAIAASVDDRSEQDDLLGGIIDDALDRGRGLKALDRAGLVLDGADRARALVAVADQLRAGGYETAALGALRQAVFAAEGVEDPARRTSVLVTVGRKFAVHDTAGAEAVAASLPAGPDRDRIRSAIAKATADRGDPEAALAMVRTLTAPDDRSAPIAAIARQRARGGDVAGATGLLNEVTAPGDRDRALAAIATARAKGGEDAEALAAAGAMSDPRDRAATLLEIHAAAGREGRPAAEEAFERARTLALQTSDGGVRNAILGDLAIALVEAGTFDRADALAAQITEADDLDRVVAATVARRVATGDLEAALAAAATLSDPAARETALADVAVRRARDGDLVGGLAAARELVSDSIRVAALRRIAEHQARTLDGIGALARPADAADPPPPPPPATATPVEEDPRLMIASLEGGGRLASVTAFPLPDLDGVDVSGLRARVPAPDGAGARGVEVGAVDDNPLIAAKELGKAPPSQRRGDVEMTMLRYSKFNFKFLQEANAEGQSIQVGVQGDLNPNFINVDGGVFTLSQVRDQLVADGRWDAVHEDGDRILFRQPILVGRDATLIVSGEEFAEMRLGSDTGAYLVVAGTLYVLDTRLVAYSESAGGPDHWDSDRGRVFRPFIVGWSDSRLFLGGSTIVSIGYPAGKGYGLSFTAGPSDLVATQSAPKPPTGIVVDNSFQNAYYGFYSYEAVGVDVIGNEYRDNVIYGIDPHDRSQDLRIAFNTIYGTIKKHGLIISREVDFSYLIGNISFDNAGSGIMLDRDSVSNIVYANTAFDNRQDGLTFFESSCNLVMANDFFDNARSGIRIRNSWDVALYANRIADNGGSGIDAYIADLAGSAAGETRDFELDPYVPVTSFVAEGNTLDANSIGATLRGVTVASLSGNVFTNHRNRIFRGDIAKATTPILQHNGKSGVRIAAKCRPRKPEAACTLRDRGFLPGDDADTVFDPAAAGDCTDVEGSLQHDAFLASVPKPAGSAAPSEDQASPAADEPSN